MSRHYFAVWLTEYPDEGSELFLAKNAREAMRRARKLDWFEDSELSASRVTRKQILARSRPADTQEKKP